MGFVSAGKPKKLGDIVAKGLKTVFIRNSTATLAHSGTLTHTIQSHCPILEPPTVPRAIGN